MSLLSVTPTVHTSSELVATGQILKTKISKSFTLPFGGHRLCALYCRNDPACQSFSVTKNQGGASVSCQTNTCNGESSLSSQTGGSYYAIYRY